MARTAVNQRSRGRVTGGSAGSCPLPPRGCVHASTCCRPVRSSQLSSGAHIGICSYWFGDGDFWFPAGVCTCFVSHKTRAPAAFTRLAVTHAELETLFIPFYDRLFLLSFPFFFVVAHWQHRGQHTRGVYRYERPLRPTPEQNTVCVKAARGFSIIIDFNLETEWSICWNWLNQWISTCFQTAKRYGSFHCFFFLIINGLNINTLPVRFYFQYPQLLPDS